MFSLKDRKYFAHMAVITTKLMFLRLKMFARSFFQEKMIESQRRPEGKIMFEMFLSGSIKAHIF